MLVLYSIFEARQNDRMMDDEYLGQRGKNTYLHASKGHLIGPLRH